MAKIYLINVGTNTGDSGKARSPRFPNGTWVYVPFPTEEGDPKGQPFPSSARPFLRVRRGVKCHLDPDWNGLSYGDCCQNGRARALLRADKGDILLFWALLWQTSRGQSVFRSHARGWYLIGALRVERIFQSLERVTGRARWNAHVEHGRVEKRPGVRVFVGKRKHSCRFTRAVDWEIGLNGGLMQLVVKTKHGELIQWDRRPHWNSVTRSCRAILDLDCPRDRKVATLLARRIGKQGRRFDLIKGV